MKQKINNNQPTNPITYIPLGRLIPIVILSALLFLIHVIFRGRYNVDFGNHYQSIVRDGQFYRLITAMFLHADFNHMRNNCISLIIIGLAYCRKNSLGKFFLVYLLGGIGAGVGSMIYYGMIIKDYASYSIGASGAIFALLGALLLFSLFRERGRERFGALIYSALVFALGMENLQTDNAAHLTGLVVGIIIEGVLLLYENLSKRSVSEI